MVQVLKKTSEQQNYISSDVCRIIDHVVRCNLFPHIILAFYTHKLLSRVYQRRQLSPLNTTCIQPFSMLSNL